MAPFKAQNMSNNSMVCPDGAEIGRAQWLQALAAGVVPEAAMNPVLLKPGSDLRSHVVLMGEPFGELSSSGWTTDRAILADTALRAFDDLRSRFDIIIAEGAGSPTEINLRADDYVNMGLARHGRLPVVVVGDIDRGGVFAAMFGTVALLSAEDQSLVAGWVINKFRGDPGLLSSALHDFGDMTGRPVLGVLPWLDDVWIDAEDALAVAGWAGSRPTQNETLHAAVVRFPRVSNTTDVDALAAEPGVAVTVTADPDVIRAAHLVVLPGSRATVSDLEWLSHRGIGEALVTRQREGKPILGICGGYQMLGTVIVDTVESGRGRISGLALLPTTVTFDRSKHRALCSDSWRGDPVDSYQIHHGRVALETTDPRSGTVEQFLDGFQMGTTWGTSGHGLFENDSFRRSWLTEVAGQAGVSWQAAADAPSFRTLRNKMLDSLADAVEQHLDTDRLLELIDCGCGPVPFVPPGAP